MNIQETGCGVLWDLELSEIGVDSDTDSIIDELAQCYDVDLDVIKASGGWAIANEERLAEEKRAKFSPGNHFVVQCHLCALNLQQWLRLGKGRGNGALGIQSAIE